MLSMGERQATMWQRFAVAVAAPVIAAAVIGVYIKLDELGANMAKMVTSVAVTQQKMTGLQSRAELGYTRVEAEKEHELIWRTDKDQYKKLKDHERRIDMLERRPPP